MDVFSVSTDSLFIYASDQTAQKEQYAKMYLEKGLQAYSAEDYDLAARHLKQAIGLSPQSDTAINAYEYIAKSQLNKGNTEGAIDAYKAMLRVDPRLDTAHISLGNLYYANGRLDEARASYEQAVRLNPSSANRYSLGQGYLATGDYDGAMQQFNLIKQQAPTEPQSHMGIGQTYAKQGRYDDAIAAFKDAIALQDDYWDAYAEMGYALADSGQTELAEEIVDKLQGNNDDLSALLSEYVYEKANPKMVATYPSEIFTMFPATMAAGTPVADLDLALSAPDSEKLFSIKIMFSKDMDRSSIENVMNWSITRAQGTGLGDAYNFGLAVPATEVSISERPLAVHYDSSGLSATVLFKVKQNAAGDGTIDPAHLNFTFKGQDAYGLGMAPEADTYSGFSLFA